MKEVVYLVHIVEAGVPSFNIMVETVKINACGEGFDTKLTDVIRVKESFTSKSRPLQP